MSQCLKPDHFRAVPELELRPWWERIDPVAILTAVAVPTYVIDPDETVVLANREGEWAAQERGWFTAHPDGRRRFTPMSTVSAQEREMTAYILHYTEKTGPLAGDTTILHVKRIRCVDGADATLVLASGLIPSALGALSVVGARHGLTRTEVRILKRICDGLSSSEIAELERMSVHTVRGHTKAILRKTGTDRQSKLIRLVFAVSRASVFDSVPTMVPAVAR